MDLEKEEIYLDLSIHNFKVLSLEQIDFFQRQNQMYTFTNFVRKMNLICRVFGSLWPTAIL